MRIGLFIPCYIDQFYPSVGIATLELLEKCGCIVEYVSDQTCCGQPLANSGFEAESHSSAEQFVDHFSSFDWIVCPSASCTMHVRHHYDFLDQKPQVLHVRNKILELSEFLTKIVRVDFSGVSFPHKVGLHQSCHGLRGLRLGTCSESPEPHLNSVQNLLSQVSGIEWVTLSRVDECCGFGGTFAVKEEAVSVQMGNDRIADHLSAGTEFITSADISCLMHLEGLIRRQGLALRTVHFAEILNGSVK
jgi:L-lactate dehydrogenase complex protein LldE